MNFANALIDCLHNKIICLNGTWPVPKILDNDLFMDSFIVHRNGRPSDNWQTEHGGALIAIDKQLRHKLEPQILW